MEKRSLGVVIVGSFSVKINAKLCLESWAAYSFALGDYILNVFNV